MRFYRSILLLLLVTITALAQTLKLEPAANPSGAGSLQAHWAVAQDGSPILSWLDVSKDGALTLRYATHRGSQWSQPHTIVENRRFFRQPAESPSVISFPNGSLLAEWVELPPGSGETEYVYVSASKDGIQWTTPVMANQDRSPVQHALVSMVASGDREASLVWLEALKGEDAPSTLKRTIVNSDGTVVREEELDSDVCTCCPTSIVRTSKGLLVAYRDHTSKDIRDIAVIRFENGRWSPSKILNEDKWEINACPVNGAFAAAKDNRVAIGWYTEGDDKPRVQLVFSSDAGTTFTKPIKINTGDALGHVSTALNNDGGAFVSWIEEGDKLSRVMARLVSPTGSAGPAVRIAEGSTQSLGYPRLLHSGNETWIVWGDKTGVKTAQLK